jgi:hypothetical protein
MTVASALFEISYGARDRDGVRGRVDVRRNDSVQFKVLQLRGYPRCSLRLFVVGVLDRFDEAGFLVLGSGFYVLVLGF